MKRILIFLIVLPFAGYAQTDSLLTFSKVVIVDSSSKEQLFSKARQWMNESFVNSKAVMQISDKESGELSGKGNMDIPATTHFMGAHTYYYNCKFSLNIWVKDGKYKFQITDLDVQYLGHTSDSRAYLTTAKKSPLKITFLGQSKSDEFWQSLKAGAELKADELVASLEKKMKSANPATDF